MNIISKGIDISKWQGDFDMKAAVNEGIKFVIIKGGGGDDGLYKDSKFEKNYEKAKANALPVGVYWFSKALSTAEAVKEADYVYNNVLKGKKFELPVYIDVENKTQLAVGKRALTDIVKAWCARLETLGYWVGIYSSLSYFSTYMYDSELTGYAHWVAQWAQSCTYGNTSCLGVWQFGGETNPICSNKVAGVTCDQDYLLIDYPTLIKKAGRNGYTATATSTTTTNTNTNTNTTQSIGGNDMTRGYFKQGDANEGVYAYKQLLITLKKAGIITQGVDDNNSFGAGTTTATKQVQKAAGITVDGLAGAKTIRACYTLLAKKI